MTATVPRIADDRRHDRAAAATSAILITCPLPSLASDDGMADKSHAVQCSGCSMSNARGFMWGSLPSRRQARPRSSRAGGKRHAVASTAAKGCAFVMVRLCSLSLDCRFSRGLNQRKAHKTRISFAGSRKRASQGNRDSQISSEQRSRRCVTPRSIAARIWSTPNIDSQS